MFGATKSKLTQQSIKYMHLKQIFLHVLRDGCTTRTQLAKEMKLSVPSISELVDELLSNNILTMSGDIERPPMGRPRALLRINNSILKIPVIEFSPQGYIYTLYDLNKNIIEKDFIPYDERLNIGDMSFCRREVDSELLYNPLLDIIKNKIKKHICLSELILVLPGTIDRKENKFSSSVLNIKTTADILDRLEETKLGVIVKNSSDCYAYAEKYFQPVNDDFIFINISYGVGAGIMHNGKIFSGSKLRSGEIGHISVDYNGIRCSCGNRGCLERYISIGAIISQLEQCGWNFDGEKNITKLYQRICEAYKQGDEIIEQVLDRISHILVIGISNMLAIFHSNEIVLGGGIEKLGERFLETVLQKVNEYGFRKVMNGVNISFSKNSEENSAIGAVGDYIDNIMDIKTLLKNDKERCMC